MLARGHGCQEMACGSYLIDIVAYAAASGAHRLHRGVQHTATAGLDGVYSRFSLCLDARRVDCTLCRLARGTVCETLCTVMSDVTYIGFTYYGFGLADALAHTARRSAARVRRGSGAAVAVHEAARVFSMELTALCAGKGPYARRSEVAVDGTW